MFNWTSSASSSPSPAAPRSIAQGGAKPPTPPPEPSTTTPAATLDSALAGASEALTQARHSSAATTEDDFELIDWCAADQTALATSAEQSTDARILALTNAVAQLTAVLQADAAASAPVSPASSAHSAAAPGAFPESPQVSCHGRTRPAATASTAVGGTRDPPGSPDAAAPHASLDVTLRRMESRLTRLEHLVTHALTSLRGLYPDGVPFVHPVTVRDLHAWGTQVHVASPNTTVAHVKKELARQYPGWVSGCRLVWAGIVLQDEQYVAAVVPAGGVVILMGPSAGAGAAGGKVVGKGCHVQGAAKDK